MLVSGDMAKAYWINDWEKDVTTAIRHNTELGTPVVFIDWTTKLINGEADYVKKLKKSNMTISSTSASGGQQASGGGSTAWKPSGEPNEAAIFNIDITVLYGNVSKLKEKPWCTLPKVTRQWFIDNPTTPCPAKFKSNNNNSNNNKKKKSTRSVSFAETDGDYSGGEDEADGDSSSSENNDCSGSENDDSSTSSDGSGDS